MSQKSLGLVLVVLGIAILLVDASFTMEFMARGLELHKSCPLPPEVCPFIEVPWQGILLGVIAIAILVIGIFAYRKLPSEAPRAFIDRKRSEDMLKKLEGDERMVYQLVVQDNGMVFQSSLIEKTGFTKVKVSRILDSLESKGLLERKRRGMTNIVVLK